MSFLKSRNFFDSSIALLKNRWLPFVLGLPLFFCLHYYEGIICDARLYLLQVINKWQPERFINDPPFMFGNQDSYGFFSIIYGFVIQHFHIDSGTFYFTLFGYLLWLLAAFYFIYKFTKKFNLQLWLFPLIISFLFYSGKGMPNDTVYFFHYIESFNCSRLFSIGIAIFGIGFILAEKKYLSLICLLFGTSIHPLTAGWCLPLWAFVYYPKLRIPTAALSALLPLTFLLHMGPLDIYPTDWGGCTRNHDVSFQMLYREFVAVLFFGLVVPKFTFNPKMIFFSKSVFWVLLIGLYWTATGGVGKHILIYQVQTWRVEWIFFVLALPTYVYLLLQTRILHGTTINTRHIALLMFGYGIFMPNSNVCVILISIFLLITPTKKTQTNLFLLILAILSLSSAGMQQFAELALMGLVNVFFDYSFLYKEVQNLLLLEFFIILGLSLFWILKRKYQYTLPLLLLLFFCLYPQFLLIPIISVCLIFYTDKHINLRLFFITTLFCFIDCIFDHSLRDSNILCGFPKQVTGCLIYSVPIIMSLILYFVSNSINQKISMVPFFACFILLILYGVDNYDKRPITRKHNELLLEQFKQKTIFPQVKDRGKLFFLVHGEYISQPRFQFLTGAYFDETTHMGEPLFKGQFVESRRRDNLLFFKEFRNYRTGESSYEEFVKKELIKKDTLLDRINFLCSVDEISHLVSNLRLRELDKLDSYQMDEFEIIYLYGCPNAKD